MNEAQKQIAKMFTASAPLPVKECGQCLYKQDPQGGHCYMFKNEPDGEFCGAFRRATLTLQRSAHKRPSIYTRARWNHRVVT